MPKFLDIKLREYIFSPRFKNQNLDTFLEFKHDYTISKDAETSLAEASYFTWMEKDVDHGDKDEKLGRIFKMEEDLLLVLAKMEYTGVYVDREKLVDIGKRLDQESKRIEQEIYDLVGETFNINSAKQVQYILFDKLKIPAGKKIKTGFSVDNEVLSFIGKDYEIANMILSYRWLKKLQSTYVEWLLKEINPKTGRIHTTYNQVQASTGRLSSENPNLQNIPAGDGYAMEIKSCFVPKDSDYVMLVADYSQVELRVLANLTGDTGLLEAFKKWEDIHARTAHFIFGEETKITSELRRIAKSVNFGVIYGITGFGLSKMINSSPADATKYIETFFAKYPKVREYYDGILHKARECGYVETFFGRRRYIPSLNDANNTIRSGAEREAMNMPIQWTAADVIKLAMISLDATIISQNLKSRLLMQVHDELVFEVHKDEKDIMEKIVRETMEGVFHGEAKLIVDLHFWKDWAEAKG